jgi:PAS domain S-box-containing protein
MNDSKKTKVQLIKELEAMRQLISDMENEHFRTDELIFQSVHSWEDTFNNITDMITIHDKDFNIVHANKAAEKILGLPFLKVTKAKCYEHYHGESAPPKGCPSCTCVLTGEPVQFEKYEPHLNKFLEIRAMPQYDSNNQLIGVIHIVRDITERKQMEAALQKAHDELELRVRKRTAELVVANQGLLNEIAEREKSDKALRESESKFKRLSQEFNVLLNAIPDNLILLSPDMKIKWANKAAASAFSKDASDLEDQDYFSLYDRGPASSSDYPSVKCFRTGKEETSQVTGADGKVWDVRAFPLRDETKNVKNVMVLARDITAKVRMEEEARIIQAKLIHANKMTSLGTLVSGVAHEINNPNTFIKSNAQLFSKIWKDVGPVLEKFSKQNGDFLLGGLPCSEVRELAPEVIKGIDEGSIRIQHIVDNLRDFARPEKANLNGSVNINDLVIAAESILRNHIKKYTEKFQLKPGGNIPPIRGSSQQIEQVVINLIMNSLQSLEDKKCAVRVSTTYNKFSKLAIIKVKDEGIGMTRDTLERITEPFFTTKLEKGGTGLGLSISYAIIKDHNGSLEFKSRPGKGTTATVKLPVYNKS